tara:strand:- start:5437 stop:9375 length:3939 start_codon:yes stop_codon:yes gene_type:complete
MPNNTKVEFSEVLGIKCPKNSEQRRGLRLPGCGNFDRPPEFEPEYIPPKPKPKHHTNFHPQENKLGLKNFEKIPHINIPSTNFKATSQFETGAIGNNINTIANNYTDNFDFARRALFGDIVQAHFYDDPYAFKKLKYNRNTDPYLQEGNTIQTTMAVDDKIVYTNPEFNAAEYSENPGVFADDDLHIVDQFTNSQIRQSRIIKKVKQSKIKYDIYGEVNYVNGGWTPQVDLPKAAIKEMAQSQNLVSKKKGQKQLFENIELENLPGTSADHASMPRIEEALPKQENIKAKLRNHLKTLMGRMKQKGSAYSRLESSDLQTKLESLGLEPNEIKIIIKKGKIKFTKEILDNFLKTTNLNSNEIDELYAILEEYNLYDKAFEESLEHNHMSNKEKINARQIKEAFQNMNERRLQGFQEITENTEIHDMTRLLDRSSESSRPQRTGLDRIATQSKDVMDRSKRTAKYILDNIKSNFDTIKMPQITTEIELQSHSNIKQFDNARSIYKTNIQTADFYGITDEQGRRLEILGEDMPMGNDFLGKRPKITFNERINLASHHMTPVKSSSGLVTGAGSVLLGYGISKLLPENFNRYGNAMISGAGADVGTRILSMAAERTFTSSATRTAITGLEMSKTFLRGGLEGAALGVALMPLSDLLNKQILKTGASHVEANLISDGAIGGLITGAIVLGSLAAAPETLGFSLFIGLGAMLATAVVDVVEGKKEDIQDKTQEDKSIHINSVSSFRTSLIRQLPENDYDFQKLLKSKFDNLNPEQLKKFKEEIGYDDDTWDSFSKSTTNIFMKEPKDLPPEMPDKDKKDDDDDTPDKQKVRKLFKQYVQHQLVKDNCGSDTGDDCKKMKNNSKKLTDEEFEFLNEKSANTWLSQANQAIAMSENEMKYTQKRVNDAQNYMLNEWKKNLKTPEDIKNINPYMFKTANIDKTFEVKFDNFLKLDSQRQIIQAFNNDGTEMKNMPKNIRIKANLDPHFKDKINLYYDHMIQTSQALKLTIPQLANIQKLPQDKQEDLFKRYQFDNVKGNPELQEDAEKLSLQEDLAKSKGYYDLDQGFLETADHTHILSWKPSDSQILQAHNAGMNLNQYVEYIHQLALGKKGDYDKLTKFTDADLKAFGIKDRDHFYDELKLRGYDNPDKMYSYDENTRQFTLLKANLLPNNSENKFISKYTPKYLLDARKQYTQDINQLNLLQKTQVDKYNTNLRSQIHMMAENYDKQVYNINQHRLWEGRNDLLFFHTGKLYDENHIEFQPYDTNIRDAEKNEVRIENDKPFNFKDVHITPTRIDKTPFKKLDIMGTPAKEPDSTPEP